MNERLLELALRKQRLQLRSIALREQWAGHAAGLRPLLDGADRVGDGVRWLRGHPQILIAGAVALLVARPKAVWRWGRRGLAGWEVWRQANHWLRRRLGTAT